MEPNFLNISDRISYQGKDGTVKRNKVFGAKTGSAVHVLWDDNTQSIISKENINSVTKL